MRNYGTVNFVKMNFGSGAKPITN